MGSDDSFVHLITSSNNPAYPVLEQFDEFLLGQFSDSTSPRSACVDHHCPSNINVPAASLAGPSSQPDCPNVIAPQDQTFADPEPLAATTECNLSSQPDCPNVITTQAKASADPEPLVSTTESTTECDQTGHAFAGLIAPGSSDRSLSEATSTQIEIPCDSLDSEPIVLIAPVTPTAQTSDPVLAPAASVLLSEAITASVDSPSNTVVKTGSLLAATPNNLINNTENTMTTLTKSLEKPRKSRRNQHLASTTRVPAKQTDTNSRRKRQRQSKYWCYVEADEDEGNDEGDANVNEELGTTVDDNGQRRSKRKRN